ncbi:hypothetical protein [Asticcacaulis sp. 201]|uniref:hypothetical protein n=1 Tax=Asticcacaulis sp. 201 TaxID=3028787 RepID=UPI002915C680|nr:hypothetical protein [Asticcacaulis sp. 201]MDV6331220.1 hypothetical protein [Asticcacaulis sp. 201]
MTRRAHAWSFPNGRKVLETSVASDPETLCMALKAYMAKIVRVNIEASAPGIWLARELKVGGLPLTVVEAHRSF